MSSTLRRRSLVPVTVALALGLFAAANVTQGAGAGRRGAGAAATLYDAEGNLVGTVTMLKQEGKVKVQVNVGGIEPTGKFHGIHIHSVGTCDPNATDTSGNPSPFFTAGGHYNPNSVAHGDHPADFPPLLVMADGTQRMTFRTDRFRIRELFDEDGSAIIIHASPDNLANIPTRYHSHVPDDKSTTFGPDAATLATGDAGARFACGEIVPFVS